MIYVMLFWNRYTRSPYFVNQHNNLNAWKKRNEELEQIEPVRMIKDATEINLNKLPLTEGMVHFIRQVDGRGMINLLNEVFEVGTEFIGEYVWAAICLKKQKLEVYYRAQDQDVAMLIKNFSYEISEEIKTRQDVWKN